MQKPAASASTAQLNEAVRSIDQMVRYNDALTPDNQVGVLMIATVLAVGRLAGKVGTRGRLINIATKQFRITMQSNLP